MTHLTDKDRETLAWTRSYCACTDSYCSLRAEVDRAVSAIVAPYAEALARVEALAANWCVIAEAALARGDERVAASLIGRANAVRAAAALAPAPTETEEGDGSDAWDCDHHPEWADNQNRCHHPSHGGPRE